MVLYGSGVFGSGRRVKGSERADAVQMHDSAWNSVVQQLHSKMPVAGL